MAQPTRIISALRARLITHGRAWMFGFVRGDAAGTMKLRYGVFRPRGDNFKGSLVLTTAEHDADNPTAPAVRTRLDTEATRVSA